MARLASQEKAGYFPLPTSLLPTIASHIQRSTNNGRFLDPCAGEGSAAVALSEVLGLSPFGIELHEERGSEASGRFPAGQFLTCDFRAATVSRGSMSLLYLNPPYDTDDSELNAQSTRLEYQWLRDTRGWLTTGGVLVYVVPQHVLGVRAIGRYMAGTPRI